MQAADFSELFGSEDFSDVNVLLYEEVQDPSSSPQQAGKRLHGAEEVLPGHKLVLRALSQYFKTKVDSWSMQQPSEECLSGSSSKAARTSTDQDAAAAAAQQQQQPGKPQIKLPVPVGQLPVGRLLIKSMYEARPDLSCIDQAQLVQLIILADRYEVPKVVVAAAAVIRDMQTHDLQWETVFSLYQLPAGLAGTEPLKELQAAAFRKVEYELGDLEMDWDDAELEQRLIQLPFPLLQQLLADPRTRVASEDTVLYTLERWCAWQQQHMPPGLQPTDEQLRELVGLVRMSYCSKAYVATVFAAGTVAARALQRSELTQAAFVAGTRTLARDFLRSFSNRTPLDWPCAWPVLNIFRSWAGYRRTHSPRNQVNSFDFSAEKLERLYLDTEAGAAAAGGEVYRAVLYHEREVCFQGGSFCCGCWVAKLECAQRNGKEPLRVSEAGGYACRGSAAKQLHGSGCGPWVQFRIVFDKRSVTMQ